MLFEMQNNYKSLCSRYLVTSMAGLLVLTKDEVGVPKAVAEVSVKKLALSQLNKYYVQQSDVNNNNKLVDHLLSLPKIICFSQNCMRDKQFLLMSQSLLRNYYSPLLFLTPQWNQSELSCNILSTTNPDSRQLLNMFSLSSGVYPLRGEGRVNDVFMSDSSLFLFELPYQICTTPFQKSSTSSIQFLKCLRGYQVFYVYEKYFHLTRKSGWLLTNFLATILSTQQLMIVCFLSLQWRLECQQLQNQLQCQYLQNQLQLSFDL